MKKIILAGASTLAILAFAGSAQAQGVDIDVSVDLNETLDQVRRDADGFGGVYINAAINDARVDGSVSIDTDGLLEVPGLGVSLNAQRIGLDLDAASATAVAVTPGATVIPTIGLATASALDVGLEVLGTSISSTDVLKTTAIGAVNTGVTSLAALSTREFSDDSTENTVGANVDLYSSAANSAASTSNTEASAAAAATTLLIDGATSDIATVISDNLATGPSAIVAANLAVNNAVVDGSVSINDATRVAIDGTATTAIGAVNTGTITNGLPGSITIVAGDTSSTTTRNNNTTTTGGTGSTGGAGSTP